MGHFNNLWLVKRNTDRISSKSQADQSGRMKAYLGFEELYVKWNKIGTEFSEWQTEILLL